MILEACVENYSEAISAQKAGANRIELCENLNVGGTTPSYGTIKLCCEELTIPIAIMIRPRGGDFCYSEDEFRIMQEDIKMCKKIGVQGIVLGILTSNNKIDVLRTKTLIDMARPMQVVFHKAFDEATDPFEALEQLIDLGINRILTSGTKATAFEGKEVLNKLIAQAANRTTILVAGKVTFENVEQLRKEIPTNEFHGRKIVPIS